jgi:8-oxo-dGTP diphosphatase
VNEEVTQVSVGILFHNQQFLVCIRPEWTSFSGFYEFPGGKLEVGESAYDALCREFKEEVGITIKKARHFMDRHQTLPMRPLHLAFWLIEEFDGIAHPQEGQELHWLSADRLEAVTFLPANQLVIESIIREFIHKPH